LPGVAGVVVVVVGFWGTPKLDCDYGSRGFVKAGKMP